MSVIFFRLLVVFGGGHKRIKNAMGFNIFENAEQGPRAEKSKEDNRVFHKFLKPLQNTMKTSLGRVCVVFLLAWSLFFALLCSLALRLRLQEMY